MASAAEKLIEQARALSPEERWRIVDELIALDEGQQPELQGEARQRFIAGIQKGLASADAGRWVEDEDDAREMAAYIDRLEAERRSRRP